MEHEIYNNLILENSNIAIVALDGSENQPPQVYIKFSF